MSTTSTPNQSNNQNSACLLNDIESHYYYSGVEYDDLGKFYIQIMEACRPFYSLPTRSNKLEMSQSSTDLLPRLDDALLAMKATESDQKERNPVR